MRSADCAQPHNGEFAGLYTAPDIPYPADAAQARKLADPGCEAVVAKFLGFGSGHGDNPVVGWMWTGFTERSWKVGDRTTQCYAIAYTPSGNMTGSVRGIGARRPPG